MSPAQKTGVNVFAGSQRAGRLERGDVEDDTLFTYRAGCPGSVAVSLTLPVRRGAYGAMAGLLPVFDMNLPEGALREHLRRRFGKATPGFADLDLLSIVGASQIGRLRYTRQEEPSGEVPPVNLEEILT